MIPHDTACADDNLSAFAFVMTIEDWFNTYLGYLKYVSWCTHVWHVDVTIGYVVGCSVNGLDYYYPWQSW